MSAPSSLASLQRSARALVPSVILALSCTGLSAADDSMAPAPEAKDLEDAVLSGTPTVGLRYRYDYLKYSDDPSLEGPGEASTLRTAVGYHTKPLEHFSAYAEIYDVAVIGQDGLYNDTYNGVNRPTIVDPMGSGVNEAYGEWADKELADTTIKVGRQLFTINDEVFVTASRYRQNQDRNDGATLETHPDKNLELQLAYLYRNIDVTNRDSQMRTEVGNLAYAFPNIGRIAVYALNLDYERFKTTNRDTYGARIDGPFKLTDDLSITYEADIARQHNADDNPLTIKASYWMAHGGLAYQKWFLTVGLRHESADTNGVAGTQFEASQIGYPWPWRGNMEEFVFNPDTGLKTLMVWGGGALPVVKNLSFDVFYFDFTSTVDSIHYGSEFSADLDYVMPFDKHWSFDAIATRGHADDTNKQSVYLSGTRLTGMTTYAF